MMKSVAMRKTVAMKASANQTPKISFVRKVAQTAGVAVSTLALTGTALAGGANVKLGADNGGLVFDPSTVTINKGDSVTWTNNAGFPHNIMFDEDEAPAGVNVDKLSHEDYLNAPGEKASSTFDVAGTYSYYCEPHQGAGMQGKVIVK
jgi:plastocyanin